MYGMQEIQPSLSVLSHSPETRTVQRVRLSLAVPFLLQEYALATVLSYFAFKFVCHFLTAGLGGSISDSHRGGEDDIVQRADLFSRSLSPTVALSASDITSVQSRALPAFHSTACYSSFAPQPEAEWQFCFWMHYHSSTRWLASSNFRCPS